MDLGGAFMQPMTQMAQLGSIEASTKLHQIQATQAQQNFQDQQETRALMMTLGAEGGSPTQMLEKAVPLLIRQGKLAEAEKVNGNLFLAEQRAAHTLQYKAQAAEHQAKADHARMNDFVNMTRLFPDTADGWAQFKQTFAQANGGEIPATLKVVFDAPYQPGMVKALENFATDAKSRAEIAWKQAETKRAEALTEKAKAETGKIPEDLKIKRGLLGVAQAREASMERHRSRQDAIAQGRLEDIKSYHAAVVKNGGKNGARTYGIPTERQEEQALNEINAVLTEADAPVLDSKSPQSKVFVTEIASRARQIQKDEGLDWGEALREAVEERSDEIEQGTRGGWFTGDTKSTVKKGAGATASKASAVPKQISSQAEYTALPVGAKYIWGGKEYTKGSK